LYVFADTKVPTTQEAEVIVLAWLDELSKTVAEHDLPAHMQLVSRHVQVAGIPNAGTIDYDGWKLRRFNEFNGKLLQKLSYQFRAIINTKDEQIIFNVQETMKGNNGNSIVADKDVILRKEKDGRWRVRYERYAQIMRPH
jgi:hypothetical protein